MVFDRSSRLKDRVMNIAVKSALAGLAMIAQGCATPVEIADDVLPAEFGDGGAPLAGAGGEGGAAAGQGGTGAPAGGGGMAAGSAGVGGTAVSAGGSSAGSSMQAAATSPLPAAAGTGGAGSSAGGATSLGGAAGAADATDAAGTGGVPNTEATAVFDPTACNFDDPTGCEGLACLAACPTNDSGSCNNRCQALVTCVASDPECNVSEADPLCAARINGTPTACTQEADSAGGADTTVATQPAFVARRFVECICTVPRP
jgi:hypothetical protein